MARTEVHIPRDCYLCCISQIDSTTQPADAFCGGRTNAVRMYHHIDHNEEIHYIDYTSLYPFINKTSVYPKGHPSFITQPGHTDISQYFGFMKCKVLPPRQLYHPVLPYREHGKLTFPLCALCPELEMGKPVLNRTCVCPHTNDARALVRYLVYTRVRKSRGVGVRHHNNNNNNNKIFI